MRLGTAFFILAALICIYAGNGLYSSSPEMDIANVTDNLQWNFDIPEVDRSLGPTYIIFNIYYKAIDFVGYSLYELVKYAMEFGFNNPDYDYEKGISLIKLYLYIILFSVLIPMLIPLLAFIVIFYDLSKSIVCKVKERRKLREYRFRERVRK